MDLSFFYGKNIFITGHTGFKGSWLCCMLSNAGAHITGYSLAPTTNPNLYDLCEVDQEITSIIGDIRSLDNLKSAFDAANPEIVIHMAAQPIVRDSYSQPVYTYETNVLGTVNILECVRLYNAKSFLNVTTDKVYQNREWEWGYREIDPLDGFDPYSNSKSCAELVTHSYKSSFFSDGRCAISTARAGNVIGGGDFANDRIIPDCVRAALQKESIIVRNPNSTRPFQHVLEPLSAYLLILQRQYEDSTLADYYNVGPDDCDCVTTADLTSLFCQKWGEGQSFEYKSTDGPHEANFLKLDCSKIKKALSWYPKWNIETAIEKTVEWTKAYSKKRNIRSIMNKQIEEFLH